MPRTPARNCGEKAPSVSAAPRHVPGTCRQLETTDRSCQGPSHREKPCERRGWSASSRKCHNGAMTPCPLILIAGLPGAGKSTVARAVAEAFDPSMHLQVDQLRAMMVRGYLSPDQASGWSDALTAQCVRESEAAAALALTFQRDGVTVVLDDVALPPVFHRTYAQAQGMHKVLLLPGVEALLERIRQRRAVYDELFAKQAPMLHAMLSSLDKAGWTVLDTTHHSVEDTVSAVLKSLPEA